LSTKLQCQPEPSKMSDNNSAFIISNRPAGELPTVLKQAVEESGLVSMVYRAEQVLSFGREIDQVAVVILIPGNIAGDDGLDNKLIRQLIDKLKNSIGNVLVWTDKPGIKLPRDLRDAGVLSLAACDESVEMIKGRIATLLDTRKRMCELRSEIAQLNSVGQPLNSHFTQVNEEMQLAARLQRDFLPRVMPQLPELRFATIYRPVSWVSGDIYDVMRLDEEHVGFYLADAVGHGMPAALLTIFIKRAMVTKHIEGHSYTLIEPGKVLGQLNRDMVEQALSDNQFATCCYGIINVKTLQLRIANAGHPPPMRLDRDGQTEELNIKGSLLGVFAEMEYQTKVFQLQHGDKLLTYSDGVELAFVNDGHDKPLRFRREFSNLANENAETICHKLVEIIDREVGSLHPRDDVTIVGIDIL